MAKNIFISFLGTGHYKECQYRCLDGKKRKVSFIQEATLDYLLSQNKFDSNDIAYILLTEKARECNWNDGYEFELEDGTTKTQEQGLRSRLDKLKNKYSTFNYQDILISDESERDIWVLFSDLYNLLVKEEPENDINLFIDITHSFRYLPMFLIVFINYVKLFKNVTVEHISYGNYEGRDKETKVAPVVDLTDYSKLQDWTYATRSFLETGNVNSLVKLCDVDNNDLATSLQTVVSDFQTCRSIPLVEGNHITDLINTIKKQSDQDSIPPRKTILSEIETQMSVFKPKRNENAIGNENVMNGYEAAIWCFNRQLYQQAITILRENITTDNCFLSGHKEDASWKDGYGYGHYTDSERNKYTFVTDNDLKYILGKCNKVRNDFDHAGYSSGTSADKYDGWDSDDVIFEIVEAFKRLIKIKFKNKKQMVLKEGQPPYIENRISAR